MSEAAILEAVRDHLRTALSLADDECEYSIDGTHPPVSGQRFFAVMPVGSSDLGGTDYGSHEEVSIEVVITLRCGHVPKNRIAAKKFVDSAGGLEAEARDVAFGTARLHMNYTLLAAINLIMTTANANAAIYYHPLVCSDLGRPRVVDGLRFGNPNEIAGVERIIRFRGARRMQSVANMT